MIVKNNTSTTDKYHMSNNSKNSNELVNRVHNNSYDKYLHNYMHASYDNNLIEIVIVNIIVINTTIIV